MRSAGHHVVADDGGVLRAHLHLVPLSRIVGLDALYNATRGIGIIFHLFRLLCGPLQTSIYSIISPTIDEQILFVWITC